MLIFVLYISLDSDTRWLRFLLFAQRRLTIVSSVAALSVGRNSGLPPPMYFYTPEYHHVYGFAPLSTGGR